MKVSVSWLKEYVPVEMDINQLVDALTMVGLEVDSVTDRYAYLGTVLIGRITAVSPHPSAEKLKICDIDIGDRIIRVVCGAPNAKKGLVTAAALPGTEMPDGTLLEKAGVRGEISEGMLCSEGELALGSDFSGIMELDNALVPGTPIAGALNLSDQMLDIDLTPNRADCLSMIGIAREIAAIQGKTLKYPVIEFPRDPVGDVFSKTSVQIESPDHCPRYAARLVEGVSISPSPFWLQDRLRSVGLKPINNIVDVTNFVMMETGQPLHAFDFDQLEENRIIVRTAKEGETFITLDGKEHLLNGNMLMICDGEKPVALAGVMGGLNSQIDSTTSRVLIESACFSPVSIRKTSKKLGIYTDASHRFERGVDPLGTLTAVNRAAQLMIEITGGEFVEGVIDENPVKYEQKKIFLSVEAANRLLGTHLAQGEIKTLLESIEFSVSPDGNDGLSVLAPAFRVDVERAVDLMEEVARLYGYNQIPTTFPHITPGGKISSPALKIRNIIKKTMMGLGFTEAVNYSFIAADASRSLSLPDGDDRHNAVKILNPLTDDQSVMRTVLIPGLLLSMARNLSKQAKDLRLFEIGKVFIQKEEKNLPEEIEMMAGLWTGDRFDSSWHDKGTPCDFYDLKGAIEGLFNALHFQNLKFFKLPPDKCHYTRPGHSARIAVGDMEVGVIGEVHPQVLKNFDLKQTAIIFELNLDLLLPLAPDAIKAKPLPKYPSVSRDVTLIIDNAMETHAILEKISALNEKLVESIQLFDIFEGNPVPQGKKSISFRITYRSETRTLADDEINRIHKTIADGVIAFSNADLPA
jgi:phenylalanyl-tRNA synthetase beta chain